MSNIYDNWGRLVEVVLRREQLRQLAYISSREPSFSSVSSSVSGWSTPIRDDQNIQLGSSSSTVNETDWERLLSPDYESSREQLRQLAYISSREPSFSSVSSSISGWSTPIRNDQNIQLGSSSSTVNEIDWERLLSPDYESSREQLRQLAYISSRKPSFSSVSSSISGWSTPIRDDQNIQFGSSSSTSNETDWERLLPPDYEDIISRSVNPVTYATKEDLYMSLCSSPILIDGGIMSFHIDKTTGKKCYMIGAMELSCGPFYDYRKSTRHADSRFSKVAEFTNLLRVDIRGKIETQMLSPNTRYAAFLVYRLEKYSKDLQPAKGIIKFVNFDEDHDAERRATILYLQPGLVDKSKQIAVSRPDGWMEVQLGMFYNDLRSYGPVEARLLKCNKSKFYLFIEGIEFRPANAVKN